MKTLVLGDVLERIASRPVRAMRFEERSLFAVSAACVVANAMRDALVPLLRAQVELRLVAPVVPSAEGWSAIADGACVFRIPGARTDGALILRSDASATLVSAAFGEHAVPSRVLSPVEERVLGGLLAALAPALTPVCGAGAAGAGHRLASLTGFTTYFEVLVERPVEARVGIALCRDPRPEIAGSLVVEDLADLELELDVRTEGVLLPASDLAAIEIGSIVPITDKADLNGIISVAGRRIAGGECGVRGNRLAVAISLAPGTERGSEPDHDR